MEKIKNCDLVIYINHIENISIFDEKCEIFFVGNSDKKYKIFFDYVWDFRYAIENAYIDRLSKAINKKEQESSVLVIDDSEYIKYFDKQVSGTRETDDLKNYIIYDEIDTIVDFLCLTDPVLFEEKKGIYSEVNYIPGVPV